MADDAFAEACTRIHDHARRHAVPTVGLVFTAASRCWPARPGLDRFVAVARRA